MFKVLELRAVTPFMVIQCSELLDIILASGAPNGVRAVDNQLRHSTHTHSPLHSVHPIKTPIMQFLMIRVLVKRPFYVRLVVYPSQFEIALNQELKSNKQGILLQDYVNKVKDHIIHCLSILRNVVHEEQDPRGVAGFRRYRRYPKTGKFRRAATPTDWAVINRLTLKMVTEDVDRTSNRDSTDSKTNKTFVCQTLYRNRNRPE